MNIKDEKVLKLIGMLYIAIYYAEFYFCYFRVLIVSQCIT